MSNQYYLGLLTTTGWNVISMKNNKLDTKNTGQLCKIHNGNNNSKEKLHLSTLRNQKFIKTYHPLKQKKVKLRKLKFVSGTAEVSAINSHSEIEPEEKWSNSSSVLSKKYRVMPLDYSSSTEWADENTVITWLISIGVDIKQISSTQYFLKNRVCLFNNVLIFANRKRVEMGLKPFYISSILEF